MLAIYQSYMKALATLHHFYLKRLYNNIYPTLNYKYPTTPDLF